MVDLIIQRWVRLLELQPGPKSSCFDFFVTLFIKCHWLFIFPQVILLVLANTHCGQSIEYFWWYVQRMLTHLLLSSCTEVLPMHCLQRATLFLGDFVVHFQIWGRKIRPTEQNTNIKWLNSQDLLTCGALKSRNISSFYWNEVGEKSQSESRNRQL